MTCVPSPTSPMPTAPSCMPTPSRRSGCSRSTCRRPASMRCAAAPTSGWFRASGWHPSMCAGRCSTASSPIASVPSASRASCPDHQFVLRSKTAGKFTYATLPFAEVYQLAASLDYLEKVGVSRIEAHTVALAQRLQGGLLAQGYQLLTPPGNEDLHRHLWSLEGSGRPRTPHSPRRGSTSPCGNTRCGCLGRAVQHRGGHRQVAQRDSRPGRR